MQITTKYYRRIDNDPSHNILILLQMAQYAKGRCHSKMQSSLPSLDAQGPCLGMRLAQSGPKPCDTFQFAIYCLQTTSKVAPSALAKFWSIPKCHAQGTCLRMPWAQVGQNLVTLSSLRSIACKRLAGLLRVCSPRFRPF